MRRISAVSTFLFVLACASILNANIYVWIDADGVKHFTNFAPPEGAEIFIQDSGVSQKPAEDRPARTDQTRPPKPDATSEVSRLQEELEALKKLLAENLEASKTVGAEKYPDRTLPVEDAYDASDDAYTEAEPERSYTTVHKYYYPYFGFGGYGLAHKRHDGKKFGHKRHYHRKSHFGDRKKYDRHRRGHAKRHWTTFKKRKHDVHQTKKHRIGSPRRHASGWNRRGKFGHVSRTHFYHRRR